MLHIEHMVSVVHHSRTQQCQHTFVLASSFLVLTPSIPCRARIHAQPHHRVKRARTHASCTRITETVIKNNIDYMKWILDYSAFTRKIFTANSLHKLHPGQIDGMFNFGTHTHKFNAGQQPHNASLTNLNRVGSFWLFRAIVLRLCIAGREAPAIPNQHIANSNARAHCN